jgi:nucleotide-binding universal stress UspA family protein
MFGRIIVATDLHASTRMSLRAACDLLHGEGQVLLVHVVRPLAGLPHGGRDDVDDRMRADAAAQMLDLASGFKRERGVDILCLTATGSPGEEIARIAVEREADLVVLAHDPVDDPATLGSVSYKVAHLAPCAVLVLKTPDSVKVVQRGPRRPSRPDSHREVGGARGPRLSHGPPGSQRIGR